MVLPNPAGELPPFTVDGVALPEPSPLTPIQVPPPSTKRARTPTDSEAEDAGSPTTGFAGATEDYPRLRKQILAGDLNPTAAFMSGKLAVDGDMGAAMRLGGLLA